MRTLIVAWRSIWRNPRRTIISMSAIGLGLALVIIYGGVIAHMLGEAKNQLDNTGLGHVEISAPGWRQNRTTRLVLADADAKAARLQLPPGSEMGVRIVSRGLLSAAHGNQAVEVHGVDWATETALSDYVRQVRDGKVPVDDAQGILIGEALAARMQLKVGHKLRLMVQRTDGEMGAGLFRVRGIFHALSPGVGQNRVLVNRAAGAELLGMAGGAHQIVIQLEHAADADAVAATARAALGDDVEVMTYAEIYPIFRTMEALTDGVIVFASLFIYFLVGLGILNTMLMSVLERTREFGVMQALGTRPSGIVRQVLAESFWTATLSVIVGLAIGLSVTWVGSRGTLLDYTKEMGEGIEMGGAVMSAAMTTRFSLKVTLLPTIYVYVMALVVALYPAWRVSQMQPVDALRSH